MKLEQVALEISTRLSRIFLKREDGSRPFYENDPLFANDPHWRDCVHFQEYFQGDSGRGLGASHQSGWTALITRCVNIVARVPEE